MPSEGAAAMYSRLQSILEGATAIVHQLMPKPLFSQVPVPQTPSVPDHVFWALNCALNLKA